MRHLLTLVALGLVLGCVTRDDDYFLLRRDVARDDGQPTSFHFAAPGDTEAFTVRRLLADGFGAELLRTHAMAKRFAARTSDTAAAASPTVVAVGTSDLHQETCRQVGYRDRVINGAWLSQRIPAEAPIVWAERDPWPGLVGGLGGAIVDMIAPHEETFGPCHPLRDGYVAFLNVVGAEWRDPNTSDERANARVADVFAAVRGNRARPASADQAAIDPTLIATVLYRMAGSELARRMVADDVYRPFFESRPPRGIPPGLLLGAFRNLQAKLLSAWGRAVSDGHPPRNLVDLIEAYGAAYPDERAEATRIFVVTTYGATMLPEPVSDTADLEAVYTQLAALTADVLFGRRTLRDAMFGHRRHHI